MAMPKSPAAALRRLRERLPLAFSVRLAWVDRFPGGEVAFCRLVEVRKRRPHYLIELSHERLDGLPDWVVVDVVAHEYAHAMAWVPALDDHSDQWGMAYSLAYRALFGGRGLPPRAR